MNKCTRNWILPVVLAIGGSLTGCGAVDDRSIGEDVGTTSQELNFRGWMYDSSTQCNVGGTTMHCCPGNTATNTLRYAMIGARLDTNTFKCAQINPGTTATPFLDTTSFFEGMKVCPFGAVMVGYHQALNQTACVNVSVSSEFIDGPPGTQDSALMHVCAPANPSTIFHSGAAMSGISSAQNKFLCAQ